MGSVGSCTSPAQVPLPPVQSGGPLAATAAPVATPVTTPVAAAQPAAPAASAQAAVPTTGGGGVAGASGGVDALVPLLTQVVQLTAQVVTLLTQQLQQQQAAAAASGGGPTGTPPASDPSTSGGGAASGGCGMAGCGMGGSSTASPKGKDDTSVPGTDAPPAAGSSGSSSSTAPGTPAKKDSKPATGGGGTSTPAPAGTKRDPHEPVLLIGDSLSVGIADQLKKDLPGQDVTVDARVSRPLAEGMAHYDAVKNKPRVVEMALFTNDGPNQIDQLHKAVQQTINDARARGGRVVWATIVRPGDYGEVNRMLRDMAAKNKDVMGLVDWAQAVQDHPDFVGSGDHVHGTAAGYAWRAQAFADAAKQ